MIVPKPQPFMSYCNRVRYGSHEFNLEVSKEVAAVASNSVSVLLDLHTHTIKAALKAR